MAQNQHFHVPQQAGTAASSPRDNVDMNESIGEIQRLIREIVAHLSTGTKMDARKAVAKLERIAALASTAALTIQIQR